MREQLEAVLAYLLRTPASALVNREIVAEIRQTLDKQGPKGAYW